IAWATSRSNPGRLTLRRACRKYPPLVVPRSTSGSMATSAGSRTFILAATILIADRKQADQPTANSCSGLVPVPGVPGTESLTSKRPSEVWDDPPSRPPVVWALAVYSTFSIGVMLMALLLPELLIGDVRSFAQAGQGLAILKLPGLSYLKATDANEFSTLKVEGPGEGALSASGPRSPLCGVCRSTPLKSGPDLSAQM